LLASHSFALPLAYFVYIAGSKYVRARVESLNPVLMAPLGRTALHLDCEPKLNIAACLPTADTPVLFWNFAEQYFHVILRNAEWL